MAKHIKIDVNEDGKAIARLYGVEIDLTDKADGSGKGTFKFAGDEYAFEINGTKAKRPQFIKATKTAQRKETVAKKEAEGETNEV